MDPFFAGCPAALTGRKGRQPLGFSQVLSAFASLRAFSALRASCPLFQVVEVTARFGQDFSLQDGCIPFFLEPPAWSWSCAASRRFWFRRIFQGLGGLEGRLAGLAPAFSLVPLCIDGAFIPPGFLFIRHLFFGDAQVGQALFPPPACSSPARGVVAGFSQLLEPRVVLGVEEGLHDLLALTGTGQEELAEVALWQEDAAVPILGQRLGRGRLRVPIGSPATLLWLHVLAKKATTTVVFTSYMYSVASNPHCLP